MKRRYLVARSALDRFCAASLLIATAPIMITTAIMVHNSMGSPILFKQERVGQYGRTFTIIKFRTMVRNAEKLGGGYFPDELRLVPPLGAWLRKTSLDELPQLFNILRGDMAFVGPRPALPDMYERYTPEQKRRVLVPQGVTGLAQIRHRNAAPWSVRIQTDLEYVEHFGVGLDLRILLGTVGKVLVGSGVRAGQTAADVDDLPPATAVEIPGDANEFLNV